MTLTPVYLFNSSEKKEILSGVNSEVIANNGKTRDNSQALFIGESQKSGIESPDFSLVGGNSLVNYSPPAMVTPQILGTLIGEEEPEIRKEIIEYTVQQGETLLGIAEKFNVSLNTLVWANNLSSTSKLKEGQKLIILPISGTLHYVRAGDTMGDIATKYKADAAEIIAFNELSGETDIFAGDILVIPDGIMPATKPTYTQVPLANSYFIVPTKGRISQGLHWYNAVDFANACGSPIYAAAEGTVLKVR